MCNQLKSLRHVGYSGTPEEDQFYAPETIRLLSQMITRELQGVVPGRDIVVTDRVIAATMDSVLSNAPRFNSHPLRDDCWMPPNDNWQSYHRMYQGTPVLPITSSRGDISSLLLQVVESVTKSVRTEYGIMHQNSQLSIWNTVLGEQNELGLRSHPPIKLRRNRPPPMLFNMN